MLRGIYNAVSSNLMLLRAQDVIEDNLLHIQTPGYKQKNFAFTLTEQRPIVGLGNVSFGGLLSYPYVSIEQASLEETGRNLDLAVSGGFLAVDANGQRLWASSLRMLVDEQGYLVTPEGYRVLGKNGPIKWNENYNVDQQGNILLNDQIVDSFLISDVNVQEVVNDRYFVGEQLQSNFRVFQTYLETSNVDEIGQVTALMTILRHYQSNVKVVQAEDAALAKIINIMV
ncbi:flagellar hook-basal body complex protein [Coprothermobacter proteolyticus DSM 5265]|uniref:Flagellar hook-basal body complex protein, putative n=1 Tax=Coprothermobacter proteolyticus (strain ATCC 35245 / DSM 5265 / OCM 4 / BT) TaxID=309798 RepID=B5Y7B7_COPPD|nr:flagellar basal body rod C-terminal domain-containing protein [Coprothermobacter proteolyticus]ACI17362.1 flagellar hook-basal body complex protein [Coprothermobacter proteolyticus DSM 5265]